MILVRLNESNDPRIEDLRDGSEGRKKVYILHKYEYRVRSNRQTDWIGTVDQLRDAFSYTLKVGHSRDSRINRNPTTARSLETNLNRSYDEQYGATYSSVVVEIEPYTD